MAKNDRGSALRLRILLQAESFPNLFHNLVRAGGNVNRESVFRFFQIGQLAGEN